MDKKHIVRFLNEKRRGVYTLIVDTYSETISSMGVTMALVIIKEDLEKESGTEVELNYYSLAQAIAKHKNLVKLSTENGKRKWEFKDASELKSNQAAPGKFKID